MARGKNTDVIDEVQAQRLAAINKAFTIEVGRREAEELHVVIDFGNYSWKIGFIYTSASRQPFKIANAVKVETPQQYAITERRHQSRKGGTAAFTKRYGKDEDVHFVCGDAARNFLPARKLGADKYVPRFLDAGVLAILMMVAPEGHKNVHIHIGHPADTEGLYEEIQNILGGWHQIKPANSKTWIKFNVKEVKTWQESNGTAVRAQATLGNELAEIASGDEVLIADFGGWRSSLTPLGKDYNGYFEPDRYRTRTIDTGLIRLLEDYEANLKAAGHRSPDGRPLFGDRIDRSMLLEGLQNGGKFRLFKDDNNIIDDPDSFNAALGPFLMEFQDVIDREFNRGLQFPLIVCTGGGTGSLFYIIREDLFGNHPRVHPVQSIFDTIEYANVAGAVEIAYQGFLDECRRTAEAQAG